MYKTKKEIDFKGSRTSANEFGEALTLMSNGTVDVKSVISKVIKLDQVPESVKELSEHPEKYLKINAIV